MQIRDIVSSYTSKPYILPRAGEKVNKKKSFKCFKTSAVYQFTNVEI